MGRETEAQTPPGRVSERGSPPLAQHLLKASLVAGCVLEPIECLRSLSSVPAENGSLCASSVTIIQF